MPACDPCNYLAQDEESNCINSQYFSFLNLCLLMKLLRFSFIYVHIYVSESFRKLIIIPANSLICDGYHIKIMMFILTLISYFQFEKACAISFISIFINYAFHLENLESVRINSLLLMNNKIVWVNKLLCRRHFSHIKTEGTLIRLSLSFIRCIILFLQTN